MLGMEQMYKMALDPRIYPDSRLLSIMQGKDQSLPMAIAMAAKQQRDKLKTAGAGEQAQQGAKQPSVKDQMLARDLPPEHSGLAALPAENMHDMGSEQMMAGGGIVAFEDNQNQPVKLGMDGDAAPLTEEQMINAAGGRGTTKSQEEIKKAIKEQNAGVSSGVSSLLNFPGKALQSTKDWMYSDPQDKILSKAQAGTLTQADLTPPTNPNLVSQGAVANRDAYRSAPAVPAITPEMQAEIDKQSAANPPGGQKAPGGVGTPPAVAPGAQLGQDSGIAAAYKDFMGRKDPFAGLGDTDAQHAQKIAEAKNQGLSSFLMNMGAKMMTHVGPLGAAGGAGITAGMPALENSHKVVRELDNAREQFNFNKAKADELRSQGNIEAAIKYENANTDLMYKSGSLAVEHEKNAMMKPYYSAYAGYLGSGKGKDPNSVSLEDATKNFLTASKDPGTKRQLAAMGITGPAQYRDYLITGKAPLNVAGTIPEGAPTAQLK